MRLPKLVLKTSNTSLVMESTSLIALASLLLLVQLPHILNLPIWVSLAGSALIGLRVYALKTPHNPNWHWVFSTASITTLAILGALCIKLHYGYFLGRDPCVAFLFLLVSLKFAEYRRSADATLLLGLSCILLLTQYFYSQSMVSAIVTLPAVFALGHALAVLRDPTHPLARKPQLKLVGKLLLQGLPIAAALFILFPRPPSPLWSLPNDAAGQTGLSDTMRPGDIGNLSQSDEVAFRVEFNGPPPAQSDRYWRGPILTQFDGYTWSPDSRQLESYPASEVPGALEYTVMLQPHNQRWLFALDQPVSIPEANGQPAPPSSKSQYASLSVTGQLKARKPITRLTRYTQRSTVSDQFRPAVGPNRSELAYPSNMPRTVELVNSIKAESDSPLDFVQKVMQRFNQLEYYYTLQPGLLGDAPVDEFLFDTRRGFCEHYASAFTLMMRAAGLPARVVTGYLGGEMNDDYMIVRQSDAHAWSEVFIDGMWRRYDPTSAIAPSRVEQGLRNALNQTSEDAFSTLNRFSWGSRLGLAWDSINHDWQRWVVDFNNRSQASLYERFGLPALALWQVTALILGVIAFWCLWVLKTPLRQFTRRLPLPDKLWQQFEQRLKLHNIERERHESPQAFVERACRELPHCRAQISAVADPLLLLRFAQLTEQEKEKYVSQIKGKLKHLRKALAEKPRYSASNTPTRSSL